MVSTQTQTHWRSRIVGEGEEEPTQLLASPLNARIHPHTQEQALTGVLDQVGWVQRVIVSRRTGHVLDGHLRVQAAISRGEPSVPVVYVDLDEAEEKLILATLDPIAGLAGYDAGVLDQLLAEVQTDSGPVQALLDDLAAGHPFLDDGGLFGPEGVSGPAEARLTLAERFGVPPFSVLDARQGYWQQRKAAWLALGIQSELGRGDVLLGYSEQAAEEGLNFYRDRNKAAPGGSPRDATTVGADGKTVRGDGHGRPMTATAGNGLLGEAEQARSHYTMSNGKGPGQSNGQDLMRGEHTVGEAASAFKSQGRQAALQKTGDSRAFNAGPNSLYGRPIEAGATAPQSGTSVFDPVLCELVYRWFCPPGGTVLDPFAGGSVRGVVAALLGHPYVGIELSAAQVAANEPQAAAIVGPGTAGLPRPVWHVGDSREMDTLCPDMEADLLFSCPPYADLEVYSDDPRDLSTLPYAAFLAAYRQIIAAGVARLKADRFACVVVGDVRDTKTGFYRNFIAETIAAFQEAGATLYNEAILVTAVGSLPIRVGRQFAAGRKLGKTHQNVLCFFKGNPAAIKAWGTVEMGDVPDGGEGDDV